MPDAPNRPFPLPSRRDRIARRTPPPHPARRRVPRAARRAEERPERHDRRRLGLGRLARGGRPGPARAGADRRGLAARRRRRRLRRRPRHLRRPGGGDPSRLGSPPPRRPPRRRDPRPTPPARPSPSRRPAPTPDRHLDPGGVAADPLSGGIVARVEDAPGRRVVPRRAAHRLARRSGDDPRRCGRSRRRVEPPRRHPRPLPDRRDRPRPPRILRRRDRVDPPLRPRDPALARHPRTRHPDHPPPPPTSQTTPSATSPMRSPKVPGSPWSSPTTSRSKASIISTESTIAEGFYTLEATFKRLTRHTSITVSAVASASLETTCRLRVESVERFSGELSKVKAELVAATNGHRVLLACHNAAEAERLGEVFDDTELARSGRLSLTTGTCSRRLSFDRCRGPGRRRPRAVRPRRGPPIVPPSPIREPGDRQLPRSE